MKQIIKDNRWFLWPYVLFLVAANSIMNVTDKGDAFLFINAHHSPFWDQFFRFATYLGDGTFAAVVMLLVLLFYSARSGVIGGISLIGISATVQPLKRLVFTDSPRPKNFFTDVDLHFVEQVNVHGNHAMPSGHTAAGFALFMSLSIIFAPRNKALALLFFILALIVGYSRLYLAQHFLVDVYYGSLIGVLLPLIFFSIFAPENRLWNLTSKPLIRIK